MEFSKNPQPHIKVPTSLNRTHNLIENLKMLHIFKKGINLKPVDTLFLPINSKLERKRQSTALKTGKLSLYFKDVF